MAANSRWTWLNSHRTAWAILGGLITVAALLLIIAPPEETLGQGMKIVFIHAALIQTGEVGLILAGVLGAAALLTAHPQAGAWMRTVALIATLFFAAGIIASAVAAKILWGGYFFAEPRYGVIFNTLALAIIVQIAGYWLRDIEHGERIAGALSAGMAAYLIYAVANAPLILHPDNPIGSSPSPLIKVTFYGLLLASLGAAAWAVWRLRQRSEPAG